MDNEKLVSCIQQKEDNTMLLMKLYEQNSGLIVKACRRYGAGEELDDLMQECYFAVCDAARLYDPDQGASFVNYLWFWLKQHIIRYVHDCGNMIRIPSYQRERIRMYQAAVSKYREAFGRDPAPEELAGMLRITPEQLDQLKQDAAALRIGSINAPVNGENESELQDFIPDDHNSFDDVLDRIQREELAELLWSIVDTLDGRQADCIRMRYKEDLTLKQIGDKRGISAEAVKQNIEKGLRRLRSKSKRLSPFLEDYAYNRGLKGTGPGSFRRSGSSATENTALKLMDLEKRLNYGLDEL